MKNIRAARRYAVALMAVAEEQHAIDRVASDLELVANVLKSSREMRLLLTNPVISPGTKKSVFREIFSARVGEETLVFLFLLVSKRREPLMLEIAEEFSALRDEKYGIVNVDVTSAIELAGGQEKELKEQLERYTRKKVRIRTLLDASIKGGLLVRIGDTVLDVSVKHQLLQLRQRFLEGGAKLN
jgi:F-type H+-transporting ATPase subunit delta